ncbi:MAG: hypothetical protein A3E36_04535 [Candidatus Andersenbacteria bacterium RIFCSPHIGHO2_12_FULL_45_11b]|uniref:Uncharacterized protein n=1 Tax=Candidatus Andersenbacteria bacterium RIFCSPHIGHO2_12_FULL_45_11b TaxID=1797282 RepID=A0A1G1XAR3_9BACT|nr:MAG: hypothetical protein A3E36_04535 [Candidatus Andersenbacteria bacterium RIFCSPHIGHO2_12_FULL_45_11b]
MQSPLVDTISMSEAQKIMGESFVDPITTAICFGIDRAVVDLLGDVPFSHDDLRRYVGTHVLFAGYPITFTEIRKRYPHLFAAKERPWYEAGPIVDFMPLSYGWYILRKDPLSEDIACMTHEYVNLIPRSHFLPTVCEIAFACTLFYSVRNMRLFKNAYGRTVDRARNGEDVAAGDFDEAGLGIIPFHAGHNDSDVGFSEIRRHRILTVDQTQG